MTCMISPNDLQQAARDHMLGGAEPSTREQWQLCANFWAANVEPGLTEGVCQVMRLLFSCPLSKREVAEIAEFHARWSA